MTDMLQNNDYMLLMESSYVRALEGIAQGASRRQTREWIQEQYPNLHPDDLADSMAEAIMDAADVGIEREDIHPSWLLNFGTSPDA
jgi:hypothetical protein